MRNRTSIATKATNKFVRWIIEEIECRAKNSGISIEDLCKAAGVAPSTFYRWKSGDTSPTLITVERIFNAAEEISEPASPSLNLEMELSCLPQHMKLT
jgi:predicted transcriptional regulator